MDGLMMEVGPWRFDETGEPITTEGGWDEYVNMVYGELGLPLACA